MTIDLKEELFDKEKEVVKNQADGPAEEKSSGIRRFRLDSFTSPKEDVEEIDLAEDDDPGLEQSLAKIEQENWQKIRSYLRKKTIVSGYILGVEPNDLMDDYNIVTSVRGFRVIIPGSEFFVPQTDFTSDYYKQTKEAQKERRRQIASYMTGAKINFVILGAERTPVKTEGRDESNPLYDYFVVASRLAAKKALTEHYFFNEKLKESERPEVGKVVTIHVLSVGETKVKAEALGIVFYIDSSDLSGLEYVMDCRDMVSPGDTLRGVIRRITINDDTKEVAISVSPRLYDLSTTSKNLHVMKVGGLYSGKVRMYNAEKGIYTITLSNGVTASVNQKRVGGGVRLYPLDLVQVQVTEVTDTHVWGTCFKIGTAKRRRP